MPIPARVRSLWATLIHSDRLDRELDEELRAAVATLASRYMDEGLDPESARRAALREFDSLLSVTASVREVRIGAGLEACLIDLRYAWRTLRSAPAFAAVIVATLALGIGANTALFSVVDAMLLKPLPYPDPGRLVFVWLDRNQVGYPRGPMSGPDLRELRQRTRSFADLGGIWATGSVALTGDREPEQLRSAFVTTNFFDVLGIRPALGRTFVPEDVVSAEPVVLIGWELFQRRYGGDPSIVGRMIQMDGGRTRVVGVMAEDFRLLLPPDASVPDRLQAFTPFWPHLEDGPRRNHFLRVVARLAPGVTLDMAREDVAEMAGAVSRAIGIARSFTVVNLQHEGVRDIRQPLLALVAGVGLLLAIACVNVAGLLIARAAGRARESALRMALGASRARLLRQALIEGLLLTVLGVAAGIGAGAVCLRLLVALAPASLRRLESSSLDAQVLLFTITVSLFWGVLFSLAPVAEIFRASRRGSSALAAGSVRAGATLLRYRMRRNLIIGQIAMSMVLLVSAVLLVRAFDRILRVDPGFRADSHLTFRVAVPGRLETRAAFNDFTAELQRRVTAVAGITGGGIVSHIPFDDLPNWALPYSLESPIPADAPSADSRAVTAGLLESLGVTLVEGRLFTPDDRDPDRPVIVIDDMLAHELWPGQSAIGRTLFVRLGKDRARVIGVVRHLRLRSLIADLSPQLFVPLTVARRNPIAFMLATSHDHPAALLPAIRAAVASLDPSLPIYEPRAMRDYIDDARATRRFTMLLSAAFALAALVLTAVGVYGVLAYAVAHRQHELGVRRALGADTARIAAAVVREGVGFAIAGGAIGLVGALIAGSLLETQLYAIAATDPVSFFTAGALIVAGAIVACGVPAWRAASVSPMDALR